jgi:hypothetical protein
MENTREFRDMELAEFTTVRNIFMQAKYGESETALNQLILTKTDYIKTEEFEKLTTFKRLEEKFEIEVPWLEDGLGA